MKTPNWVKAKAECNDLDRIYDIISQIKKDIKDYNALASKRRRIRHFEGTLSDGQLTVRRKTEVSDYRGTHYVDDDHSSSSDVLVIKPNGDSILACRNGQLHNEIEPQWNAETQMCDFAVDGKIYPAWRISEMVLSDFPFESEK